jgi:hypothetical protein
MNDKYKKKSDTKSTKTRVKKKRQYREVKPPKENPTKQKSNHKPTENPIQPKTEEVSNFETQSFRTPEKGGMSSPKENSKEDNPTFLLIKNLGADVNEDNVRDLIGDSLKISSLNIIKNSNNVYLKFEEAKDIHQIIKNHEKNPLVFRGKKVKMCLVNKLPLDLNQKSKICKCYFGLNWSI